MLKIENLHADVITDAGNKEILKGLNLEVKAGEIHAIMGPNGSGKSSLSKVVAGHPSYQVTQGHLNFEINFQMQDLLPLSPSDRAREGIFLALQYPVEVPGVSNSTFLNTAMNAVLKHHGAAAMEPDEFSNFVKQKLPLVGLSTDFLNRGVNVGFSGGEKKRNEILQMAVLSPRLSFLDETDSGLDIDSLKLVAEGVNKLRTKNNATVMITHYQRLLDFVRPDFVHVLLGGKIVETGDYKLAFELEKRGYDWLRP